MLNQLRLNNHYKTCFIIGLMVILFSCFLIAISVGSMPIDFGHILTHFNPLSNQDTPEQIALVLDKIRLPRTILAILVGATLAACGTITQGLFRNPLADPSLIGVSAGASIGATFMIIIGSHWFNDNSVIYANLGFSVVSIGAFLTALITVFLVYKLSTSERGTSVATMLLAGIAITALAGSFTSLLQYISDDQSLRRVSLWQMGGLDGANFSQVILMTLVFVVISFGFMRKAQALNSLLLGESEARHLGIPVQRVKLQLITLVAAGVGIAVSISGGIGFIGLIVPHIMRLLIGPNHRFLIPATLVAGALLLLLADTLARTIISPAEIPVGIITAILGAPFFISLLNNQRKIGL